MSYGSPREHQDMFQYEYAGHGYHYVSDGSTRGGDETNFWSNSPSRSDSPSPNTLHPQNSINTYQIYTPVDCSTPNRFSPYITSYSTLNSEPVERVPFVRVAKRRTTANKKERRRTQSINNAYADLRDCIPNVPADTKLSKEDLGNSKKAKGRTGWPQHVWALELKQEQAL